MVNFYDPIQKIELSYHLDKKLLEKWDKIREGKLIKKDEDRVYIVDGRERVGKSVLAIQQAKYIDPSFDLSRVCFTPDEFLYAIRNAPKGSAIIFDEAFRGLSSKASQSKVNKKIVQGLMEMGQRNLTVFIVLPTIFLLEIYPAVLRSEVLFHVYKDKKGVRRWRLYNFQKKSILWREGKKKGFSYKVPRVKNRGRFFNKYAIDEKSYRDKKAKSLREMGSAQVEDEETKFQQKYYFIVYILKKAMKLSDVKLSKWLSEQGMPISSSMVGVICRKQGKITTNHPT